MKGLLLIFLPLLFGCGQAPGANHEATAVQSQSAATKQITSTETCNFSEATDCTTSLNVQMVIVSYSDGSRAITCSGTAGLVNCQEGPDVELNYMYACSTRAHPAPIIQYGSFEFAENECVTR